MGKSLSVIPYYGGKAKMSKFIADRLDYTSTNIFITLFGGGCRELLNKPPHPIEIYNEYDYGLCALMETLSNRDTAQKLIDTLYYETKPTKQQFLKSKEIYSMYRVDIVEEYTKAFKKVIKKYVKSIKTEEIDTFLKILWDTLQNEEETSNTEKDNPYYKARNCIDGEAREELDTAFHNWKTIKETAKAGGLPSYPELINSSVSQLDLAVATYIIYTLSFSGIGNDYAQGKFTEESYKKHVLSLYDCADRMNGVQVFNLDAMSFFKQQMYDSMCKQYNGIDIRKDNILYEYLDNSHVMVFADPSYISPIDERRILSYLDIELDDIDIERGDMVCDALDRSFQNKKMPKNLGSTYARSFGYKEQEIFLKAIRKAQAKVLVCNYDLLLYDKYLNKATGWRKCTYPTTTSVSYHGSGERLECIWMNY